MKKPYANDWVVLSNGVQYSESKQLWYTNGKVYDELSASHNGIIGYGAQLKAIIKETSTNENT